MKDPTIEDPRLVSAFSVYKGLANLKCYQDTSSKEQSTSKASKKKARRRNRKKEHSQNEEVEGSPTSVVKPESSKEHNIMFEKHNQPIDSAQNIEDSSTLNKSQRRKQKRKNKKKENETLSDLPKKNAPVDISVFLSDDEEEPPLKSRKTVNMVPNPLAYTNGQGLMKKTEKSKTNGIVSTAVTAKQTSSKKKISSNENIPKTKKQTEKEKATSKFSKPTSFSQPLKHNDTTRSDKTVPNTAAMKSRNISVSGSTSSKVSSKSSPYTVESKLPPVNLKTVFTSARVEDSINHAKSALDWVIHPVTSDEFMSIYWEKKPLLIKRRHSEAADYYKSILTTQLFDDILRRNPIKYGVNLDITSYVNRKRETISENMQGRVRPAVVWDYYNNGCSIRMLNPQTYIQPLWRLNSSLQEWLGSFVGANMYLTPPDSQGFAPHYDDIEAFILQIEGKKRWKLYPARNEEEKLPRFSSRNFSEETDNLGNPILDVVLEEGDLLYFPRGVIHQAQTVDGEHSLHITLSCNQLNTYGDLLKHHLNHALDKLMAKNINFRKGLPIDYLSFMGIAHANTTDAELKKKRSAFSNKIKELISKVAKEPADFASDAMGKKFIWDSLPPYLNSKERETTVVEDGEFMQQGKVFNRVEFGPETEVKFVRKNCVRLVVEEEQIKLYFSSENPLVYHEEDEPQYLELSVELAPALNYLISQYPKYTKIEDLPISSDDIGQKIQVVSDLWERGLLFTKEPLEPCDYDEFESEGSENSEETDANRNNEENEDVESINLSDLPREGDSDEDDLQEDLNDDFYDTSFALNSDDSNDDEDDEESQLVFSYDEAENSEEGESGGDEEEDFHEYGIDEDAEFDEDEQDEEDDYDDEDDDGFDIDALDAMEETDSDEH